MNDMSPLRAPSATTTTNTSAESAAAVALAPLAKPLCYLADEVGPANQLDLMLQSAIAKMTGGVSPIAMSLAFQDWLMHLAVSPGKQLELVELAKRQALNWVPNGDAKAEAEAHADTRFKGQDWSNWPFSAMSRSFVNAQQFWQQATSGVRGVEPHHSDVVNFTARQLLDIYSPSNYFWSNPEVLQQAVASKGQSVLAGWTNFMQDISGKKALKDDNPAYLVGRDVAITPGKVVYRNELVELIQYSPQTPGVYLEPVLIVPSWIMKYYILDLSPHNSLVRYLVEQGHTVFMVSWRNPGSADRDLGMDDYLRCGVMYPLQEVDRICGGVPVHAAGYCLGGTLLAIGAAAIGSGRHGEPAKLASVTLLAAQTDFTDPGELGLFIDDSELAFLDAVMWKNGYLDGTQMAGSFQLLNSRDLVWSRIMREYLLGQRNVPNDLMAWNADTTRMPYRMHSEYLKHLFLHNDLAEGRYCVDGKAVAVTDIKAPMFVVGTERDHVSPWHSVYKIHLLADTEIDFVLASGGHNAGIVSEPGHARRSYKVQPHRPLGAAFIGADEWIQGATDQPGSWWPHWHQWLADRSQAELIAPPTMGAGKVLDEAPGRNVREA
ncbi:MAG: alpha/beta fold hydrolase [Pseudomonadota bacterium]